MNVDQMTLRDLCSHEAIRQCLYRYCRGIDRPDPVMIESCYWPEAIDDRSPMYRGPVKGWIEHIMHVVQNWARFKHTLSNTLIELDGDSARTESYYTAYHRVRVGPMEWKDEFLSGRFLDRFECRNGEWRIIARQAPIDWFRVEAGQDPEEKGFRNRPYGGGPSDPSFRLFPLERG